MLIVSVVGARPNFMKLAPAERELARRPAVEPVANQTAAVMQRIEPIVQSARPDVVMVYGDVNSTIAAALVAAKMGIRIAHVEAGLRSRDWSMPEEINRVLTDRISDTLFAPSPDAVENLLAEGVPSERVHLVGNVMIDSLCWALPQART